MDSNEYLTGLKSNVVTVVVTLVPCNYKVVCESEGSRAFLLATLRRKDMVIETLNGFRKQAETFGISVKEVFINPKRDIIC